MQAKKIKRPIIQTSFLIIIFEYALSVKFAICEQPSALPKSTKLNEASTTTEA